MAARFPMIRRFGLALLMGALGLGVAACSDTDFSNSDSVRMGELLIHAIGGIGSSSSVPRSRVAAVPYATLGVRLGSSDQSLFVLATKAGDDLVWRGGPQLALTTRNGRIVRTAGFVHNLSGYQSGIKGGSATGNGGSWTYLFDYADRSRYGIAVTCVPQNLGPEQIVIIGVTFDTTHTAENCVAPQLNWTFRNEYWRDKEGFIWKSVQYVVPDLDPFTLEVLRRAG